MIAVYLKTLQFQNFCVEVGYRDSSSSIRKCIAIGKVYARFIPAATLGARLLSQDDSTSLALPLIPR